MIEIRKDALKRGLLHSHGTPILKGCASWPEDVMELFNANVRPILGCDFFIEQGAVRLKSLVAKCSAVY